MNCRKCGASRTHLYFTDDGALACIKCGTRDYQGAAEYTRILEVEKIMEITGIKIESGVPMPKAQERGFKYPFDRLRVGDSFFLKGKEMKTIAYHACRANKKHKPKRFTARAVEGGVRVWRTE